jgi:hypothetical protein
VRLETGLGSEISTLDSTDRKVIQSVGNSKCEPSGKRDSLADPMLSCLVALGGGNGSLVREDVY